MWETLALVPKSKAKDIEDADDDDRTWAKYKDVAIPLASYKDDPKDKDENLGVFGDTKPPYVGLNDCTHFTSQCLIAGGFPVTKAEARRGAGDLAFYLQASGDVTTLCWMADPDDVKAVVDADVVREGDVFAYHEDEKTPAHHTVPAVTPKTIAMHTWRGFDRPWDRPWPFDIDGERISLFHFKDDDYKTADAKNWLGWWKVETLDDPKGPNVVYYLFEATGEVTVTDKEPKNAKDKLKGDTFRWFSRAKTAVVVRRTGLETKTQVEIFQEPKTKDGATTTAGAFSNLPAGSKLSSKGTKLFSS